MKILTLFAVLSLSGGCATSIPPGSDEEPASRTDGHFAPPAEQSIEEKLREVQRQSLAPYYR